MVYYLTPASFTWFTVGGGGEAVSELTLPSAGGKRNRNAKPSYLTTAQARRARTPQHGSRKKKYLRPPLGQNSARTSTDRTKRQKNDKHAPPEREARRVGSGGEKVAWRAQRQQFESGGEQYVPWTG